jgi:hypothetical protein
MNEKRYITRRFFCVDVIHDLDLDMYNITPLFTSRHKTVILNQYLDSITTKVLINHLYDVDDLELDKLIYVSKEEGVEGTYVHPIIFMDALQWRKVGVKRRLIKKLLKELESDF